MFTAEGMLEISQYNQAFHKLVTGLYLKPSTILSHESVRDRLLQYETAERRKIPGFPTAKELRQAKEVAEARLRSEQEKEEQIGLVNRSFDPFNKGKLSSFLQKRKEKNQPGPHPNKVLQIDLFCFPHSNHYFSERPWI